LFREPPAIDRKLADEIGTLGVPMIGEWMTGVECHDLSPKTAVSFS
jgi:hypothetical protein